MMKVDGVKSVHDVHVWSLTSGMNMMSCHVDVDEHRRDHEVLEALKEVAKKYDITHTTIQIEHHEEHEGSVNVDFKKDKGG
jgi:cobalt-zinc-cadmium efflux system protein